MKSEKNLINRLGLLGIVSFASYAAAVIFAPLAYPGYEWMSRAVSDLSAANAPSLALWHRLSSLYGIAGVTCVTAVCIALNGNSNKSNLSKTLWVGIYLFAGAFWVSTVGFAAFPLSESGGGTAFTDTMHIAVTAVIVPLFIASYVLIMIGGYRKKQFVSLAVCATVALTLMAVGGIGTGAVPPEYFGVFQRFSNLISANGFLVILGIYLFAGKMDMKI